MSPNLPVPSLGCGAAGCPNPVAVQWRRRNASGGTDAVLACGTHAIALDAAAHVHLASCAAPDPARVPACNCTPEPIPATQPSMPATETLPTGWTIPVPQPPALAVEPQPVAPQAPLAS